MKEKTYIKEMIVELNKAINNASQFGDTLTVESLNKQIEMYQRRLAEIETEKTIETKIQENGNQYKLVVKENTIYVYRFSPKGTYKNVWENIISARDVHAKEIKKAGYFRTQLKNIEELKQYAVDKGYGLEIEA